MPTLLRLATFCLLILVTAPLAALTHVTSVEGIDEYRLDNGLRILLVPDESRPTTTINITYFVGSKHEGYGETGMAHLLEHMLFYGTERHGDIKAEISERGGFANGTTWYERTNYFQTLPAEEANLEWAIRMEADRMVNSLIREEDLASEMTVVRNEFEIGENNPFRILMQRVMATAYEWHGYGRATIGARSDIENVPIERLHAFYRRFYQPDNAMLILSGRFDRERALALVDEHFGAIPAPDRSGENQLWPTYTREPTQDGPREIEVRRAGSVPILMAGFHVPATAHEDFAPLEALALVLGDRPSGRLHRRLVEAGLASQVGAFTFRLREPGMLLLFATLPREADVEAVRSVFLETLDELATAPPEEAEVRRAVAALTSGMERSLDDSDEVGISLSEWAATGDWRLLFLHRDRLEAVTAEQVRAVAARYLVRDNRTVGRFTPEAAPQRAEIPEAPELAELLAGYTGRDTRAAGEAFEATPENIEARVQRFTLPGGAEVALLPKRTRGERVQGRLQMRLGSEETLLGLGAVPGMTGALLDRGTENYDRQALRDRLDELQASLSVSGGTVVSGRLESRRSALPEVLGLVAEMLQRPVFPDSELEELRRQMLTGIDQQSDDPQSVAIRELNRHFNVHEADHPNYTPSFDEQAERLRAVSRDGLVDFHRRFYGFGSGTTLALVGDFDADEVRDLLVELFGAFTPEVSFARIESRPAEVAAVRLQHQIDDKANAFLLARHQFAMRDDHPDYPALQLAGHMLGGGFLNSRLSRRIRDDEGLSYAVGASLSAHPIDELGSVTAFAAFGPADVDRLEAVLSEVLEQVVMEGFGAEELDSARTGWLQQQQLLRSDDGRLAGSLAAGLYFQRDSFHEAELEAAVEALTLAEVNAAIARWLDPAALTLSLAGDFAAREED
ncbi:MAG: insulinase family protein [Gammaproteobacteria bacterium]|nr:MAG: insulinase family protein [Gammaproteobacteria bacterium]